MKRLGLIGVGAWGRRYIDTINRRTDCCITAVARASARTEGVPAGAMLCESWQSLVRRASLGELDGVIAATTPEHQAEVGLACASASVPLLVEKPLGLSLADVERVRKRFDESERPPPLLVDYVHLWAAAYRGLKQRVTEARGVSGIVGITTEGFNWGPLRSWSSLYDYGPHDLAMSLDLLGMNAAFSLCEARCNPSPTAGFELYDVRFELGGVPVHMRVGNGGVTKARRFAVTVPGSREVIYDDTRPHPLKLVDGDASVPVAEGGPLDVVLATFLQMIGLWTSGQLPRGAAGAGLALSARVNEILDAIALTLGSRSVHDAPSGEAAAPGPCARRT
jgi:predicted dehydrogenase